MTRNAGLGALLALTCWLGWASMASAQTAPGAGGTSTVAAASASAQALPPGHPAVGTRAAAGSGELPPGHPTVNADDETANAGAAQARAHANPHEGMDREAPQDSVTTDKAVPRGSVQVRVQDGSGKPLPGVEVQLVKSFQSIAMGDRTDSDKARSNAAGEARFSKLNVGRSYSYHVLVKQGAAEYASPPFQLNRDAGQRVVLHVYPATRDINQARIAMRGLIYVQPRDDVFQCEVWFQVFNVGAIAWVPSNLTLRLPEGAKAFTSHESTGNARFESDEDEVATLHGTYAPGQQNDVRFAFQIPNEQASVASIDFPLPPHVGEFRVIVESAPGMGLSARGFPPAQASTGARGERILVTQARGSGLDSVHFQVTGLPTRGSAPWVAIALAVGIAAGGVSTAFGKSDPRRKRQQARGDRKEAKNKILDELVELEKAKRAGRIGPKAYEETRRTLLTALSRLLEPGHA